MIIICVCLRGRLEMSDIPSDESVMRMEEMFVIVEGRTL